MRIQRIGYQQNFGTNVVAKIHSPQVLKNLAILDKRLAGRVAPECRCIQFLPNEVLFADGDDVAMITSWNYGGELVAVSKKEELKELAENMAEDVNTLETEIDGDSLDELFQKVPMLQKFEDVKDILTSLFNPMKS